MKDAIDLSPAEEAVLEKFYERFAKTMKELDDSKEPYDVLPSISRRSLPTFRIWRNPADPVSGLSINYTEDKQHFLVTIDGVQGRPGSPGLLPVATIFTLDEVKTLDLKGLADTVLIHHYAQHGLTEGGPRSNTHG